MIEKTIKVKIKHGMHVRPCSMIVQKRLKSQLETATATKVVTGETANLDSILNMVLLVGNEGEDYVFRADGPDEERFINFVEELLSSKDPFEPKKRDRKNHR